MLLPTLTDVNPNELHYYVLISSLERCNGSFNTVEDPFGRIYVPNKIEHVRLKIFNIIKGINK